MPNPSTAAFCLLCQLVLWPLVLCPLVLCPLARAQDPAPTPPAVEEPRVTAPLADDDASLAPLLTRAKQAAERGSDGAALLAEPDFAPLRELRPFRELVKQRAPQGEVRLPPAGEPGRALTVRGRVLDAQGKPVADALVYAYHTSAKGWYSDRAPHFSGNGGDDQHARLFAYVRTDAQGAFVLQTIRPGGYPRSDLPEHIHLHVFVQQQPLLVTELLFDDDARLTKDARERAAKEHFVIGKVTTTVDGTLRVEASFPVDLGRLQPARK